MFGFLPNVIEVEERAFLENRIRPGEEFAVAGVSVLRPEVLAQPGRTARRCAPGGVLAGCGEAPRVGDHVRDPAARVVIGLRGFAARRYERADELVQRLLQFREIAD